MRKPSLVIQGCSVLSAGVGITAPRAQDGVGDLLCWSAWGSALGLEAQQLLWEDPRGL